MRIAAFIAVGLAGFAAGRPVAGQVLMLAHPSAPKGTVVWRNAYLGAKPQAWFTAQNPLTPDVAAWAAARPADSLSLVLLPDYHVQLPKGAHYLRLRLLNPTPHRLPLDRADATVLGYELLLRPDGQWICPPYFPSFSCGNSFWQDTLAAHSYLTVELEASQFYGGTIPVEAQIRARVNKTTLKSPVFIVQLTPLQLYYLRYPRVPFPDIN